MARSKLLILILVGIVILLLGTVGILLFESRNSSSNGIFQKQASVSGTFDINGVIPAGASITVTQKVLGSNTSSIFASNLPVADQSPWSFNQAVTGKTYQIQASVVVNGSIVATSSPLVVTAPADEEILTLNITAEKQVGNATISGNVLVSGYIPSGATIVLKGRKLGAQTFSTVSQGLPGAAHQFVSYTTAIPGQTYEVEGVLLNSAGQTIGTSNILAITAPAANEQLTINSSATPPVTPAPTPTSTAANNPNQNTSSPAGSVSISGGINLNGAAPSNSRIVIVSAPLNSTNFQVVVNNITPVDGTTWTWNGAQNATWYTLRAILKQHNANGTDTDIATSAPINVAAPATNVIFTLNSGVSLSAPGGPVTVTCQTYNGGPNQNTWNVIVNFGSVAGAQAYWYQIGTNSGGNNTINTAQQTNGASTQTLNTTFNNSTTYYAQYAYANVPVTPLGSSQWSSFSSATQLQCSH